jgi:phospholipid/cholesterol/gamma-HCH transport system ATP-binding protein
VRERPIIELEGVSKSFDGHPVLNEVTVTLDLSQLTFIIGRSGEGKSVLCRMAVGLLRPDAGRVRALGHDVQALRGPGLSALRTRLPYVVQGPALLDWRTVEENVALASKDASVQSVAEALAALDLTDVAQRTPPELGPGTQKKVAIARALLGHPAALLFDEPTTGLDGPGRQLVNAALARLKHQGLGAVVVSHDYPLLKQLADQVLMLSGGSVRFFGPVDAFLASRDEEIRALVAPFQGPFEEADRGG